MYVDNKEAELAAQIQEEIHKTHIKKLSGKFFHEPTNSGFIQVNRIEGNSVQNGTPTPDNPIEVKSFDGEVVTSGKNLFDLEYMKKRYPKNFKSIDGNTFEVNVVDGGGGHYFLDYGVGDNRLIIKAKVKKENKVETTNRIALYINYTDGSYNAIEPTSNDFKELKFVSKENKTIKNLAFSYDSNYQNLKSVFQDLIISVYEGQDDIVYEPFHATKTEKLTLRSLPNGVKDTLERQLDGSYLLTQRVSHFVFDKDEDIDTFELASKTSQDYDESLEAAFYSPRCNNLLVTGEENEYMYSNRFKYRYGYEIGNIFNTGTANKIIVVVSNDMLETRDAAGFKKILKKWRDEGKPLTVSGTLPTPIQRKVWLSPLSAYEGQTNIFANSEVGAEMEVEILTTNAVNGKLHELKENILQERPNPNLLVNADFRN